MLLLLNGGDRAEVGLLGHPGERFPADAVHGRVNDVQLDRFRGHHPRGLLDVGVEEVLAGRLERVASRQLKHVLFRGNAGDVCGDVCVGRGDDLRPLVLTAEVHLVSVVGWRVVARRDHDAGGHIEVPDGERQHGGREQAGEEHGAHTSSGHDLGGVAREDRRVLTPVVADDDARFGFALEQVRGQPRCSL